MMPFMFVFVYLIGGCITGLVTRAINMNKGYEGGFAWGFLGILGVIYVLSKPDLYLSDSLSQIIEKNEAQTGNNSHSSAPSGWTCEKCGQVNPYYTGTCVCGNTRQSQEAKIQVIAVARRTAMKKSVFAMLLAGLMAFTGTAPACADTDTTLAWVTETVTEASLNEEEAVSEVVPEEQTGFGQIEPETKEAFSGETAEETAGVPAERKLFFEESEKVSEEALSGISPDFKTDETGTILTEYTGNAEEVTIPDGIVVIGERAFYDNDNIKKLIMPDSVREIRKEAFRFCGKISDIVLSRKLVKIYREAFEGCAGLRILELPDSVDYIGEGAFEQCTRLEYIRLPQGLTSISEKAFYQNKRLRAIVIPDSVTTFGAECFDAGYEDFTILANEGSEALAYAEKNNIRHVALETPARISSGIKEGSGTLEIAKDGEKLANGAMLKAGDVVYITATTQMADLDVTANGKTLNNQFDYYWRDSGKRELREFPFIVTENVAIEASFLDPFSTLEESLFAPGVKYPFAAAGAEAAAVNGRRTAKFVSNGSVSVEVDLAADGFVTFNAAADGCELYLELDGAKERVGGADFSAYSWKMSAGHHTLRWIGELHFLYETGSFCLYNINVTQNEESIPANAFSIPVKLMDLDLGESAELAYSLEPAMLKGKRAIRWISSDPSVVRITGDTVTGLKQGRTFITGSIDGLKESLVIYVSGKQYASAEEPEKEISHGGGAYIKGETLLSGFESLLGLKEDASDTGREIRVRQDDASYIYEGSSLYRLCITRDGSTPEKLLSLPENICMACTRGSVIFLLTEAGESQVKVTGFDVEQEAVVFEQSYPVDIHAIGLTFAMDDDRNCYFVRDKEEVLTFDSSGKLQGSDNKRGIGDSSGFYGFTIDQVDPFNRSILVQYDAVGRCFKDFEDHTYQLGDALSIAYRRITCAGVVLIRDGKLVSTENYIKNKEDALNGGSWIFLNRKNYAVNTNGQIVRFYKTKETHTGINYDVLFTVRETSKVPKAVSAEDMIYVLTESGAVYQYDVSSGELRGRYSAVNAQIKNLYVSGENVYVRYIRDGKQYVAPLEKVTANTYREIVRKEHITLGYSKDSVISAYRNSLAELDYSDKAAVYASEPSVKAPYAPGRLSEKAVRETLGRLNYARWQCGLNPVTINEQYMERSQKGAVVLAATNTLTHTPAKPADMEEAFFKEAYAGVNAAADYSGNCSQGDTIYGSIKGYLDDDNNLYGDIGHRLSLLDKYADRVSYGSAGVYGCLSMYYAAAPLNNGESYYAWPSAGYFPAEMLSPYALWHIQTEGCVKDTIRVMLNYDGKDYAGLNCKFDSFYSAVSFAIPASLFYRITENGVFKDGVVVNVTMTGMADEENNPIIVTYPVRFVKAGPEREQKDETVHAKKVTLNKGTAKVQVGRTLKLKAVVSPENSVDAKLTWRSGNTKIATVNQEGLVTALRPGTVSISAVTANGVKSVCKVTVSVRYVYECTKNGVYRYTANTKTVKELAAKGWTYRKAFRAPGLSSQKVYWIYNKSTNRYRYTARKSLAKKMKEAGNKVGIAFYQSKERTVPVYELSKKSGKRTNYFYTTSSSVRAKMKKTGWKQVGIAWYAQPK